MYNNEYLLLQREWAASCSKCRQPHLFLTQGENPVKVKVYKLRRVVTLDEMQELPFPWHTDPETVIKE